MNKINKDHNLSDNKNYLFPDESQLSTKVKIATDKINTKTKSLVFEIEKLMKIPGKVRGQVFFTDLESIKEIKGERGFLLLKKKMIKLGKPIDYENIKTTEWYPVGLRAISLLVIKEIFNWDDKEIEKMGRTAPKLSFIVKMLMKTFLSIERSFRESSNYWKKHYSIGKLIPFEFDIKRKHILLHLKDFKIHPILCPYLTGYFYTIANFILKSKKITIKETKCVFKGDPYHEFSVNWE